MQRGRGCRNMMGGVCAKDMHGISDTYFVGGSAIYPHMSVALAGGDAARYLTERKQWILLWRSTLESKY